jgi:predicted transcriptional regulator
MKRTTIFIDEHLERELQALARRERRPMAGIVREAVEQYVVHARAAAPQAHRGFVALGRSGVRDTAERHEDLLWEELRAPGGVGLGPPARKPKGTGGMPPARPKRRRRRSA